MELVDKNLGTSGLITILRRLAVNVVEPVTTPLFLKPLKIGFDLSFTSATKYFSGHSDAMGGSLAVNKKVFKKVMFFYKLSGYRMSADEAYLIIRGLRTLDVRLKKHYENAKVVINFLKKQKKIKEILYPYKPSSKNYKLWKILLWCQWIIFNCCKKQKKIVCS